MKIHEVYVCSYCGRVHGFADDCLKHEDICVQRPRIDKVFRTICQSCPSSFTSRDECPCYKEDRGGG